MAKAFPDGAERKQIQRCVHPCCAAEAAPNYVVRFTATAELFADFAATGEAKPVQQVFIDDSH